MNKKKSPQSGAAVAHRQWLLSQQSDSSTSKNRRTRKNAEENNCTDKALLWKYLIEKYPACWRTDETDADPRTLSATHFNDQLLQIPEMNQLTTQSQLWPSWAPCYFGSFFIHSFGEMGEMRRPPSRQLSSTFMKLQIAWRLQYKPSFAILDCTRSPRRARLTHKRSALFEKKRSNKFFQFLRKCAESIRP